MAGGPIGVERGRYLLPGSSERDARRFHKP